MRRVLATLFALLPFQAEAAEVWNEVATSMRIADPVSLDVGGNWRLLVPGGTEQVFTEVSPTLRVGKMFRFGVGYRIGGRDDDGEAIFFHRLTFDPRLRLTLGPVRLDLRERYQIRLGAAGKDTRHTLRTRVRVFPSMDLPVRPGLGAEPFVNLGDGDRSGDGIGLDKIRLECLLRVPVAMIDLDVSYRADAPVRDDAWSHILALGATWNLDLRD